MLVVGLLQAYSGSVVQTEAKPQKEPLFPEEELTEDGRLQRFNMTQQSVNGSKLLLLTSANRVRQVVEEIEIVTQRDNQ